jgi:rhomboid protease GluP
LTQPPRDPNNDDNLEPMIERMAGEFGPRRPREGEPGDEQPDRPYVPEREGPLPPPMKPVARPQRVRVRLPRARPLAAWGLLGLNVLLYAVSMVLTITSGQMDVLGTPAPDVLQLLGWKQNDLILGGQYWRLITAMFLHGSLVHIFFNGYALYALGPEAEQIYGTPRFVAVYMLSGLAGSIASYALSPAASVGASGAIFGLFGGLLAFYLVGRDVLGDLGRRQLQSMGGLILLNLLLGFAVPGIDNYAHLGGLATGALAGWLLAPRFSVRFQLGQPVVVRRFLPQGWPGALALLLVLAWLVRAVQPPL